jgi:SPP1 gp7 family putative phage head morphogenesis protein
MATDKTTTATTTATLDGKITFVEALAAMEARGVILPTIYYSTEFLSVMRSYTFSVAGIMKIEQLTLAKESLVEALAQGLSRQEWKAKVIADGSDVGKLSQGRLDNIYRTNLQSMYGRGRAEHAIEFATRRPYLMYNAINDLRVRPAHLAMDNFVAPVGSPVWSKWFAPCGFRCRCQNISLTEAQSKKWLQRDNQKLLADKDLLNKRLDAINNTQDNFDSPLSTAIDDPIRAAAAKYSGGIFNDYLVKNNIL